MTKCTPKKRKSTKAKARSDARELTSLEIAILSDADSAAMHGDIRAWGLVPSPEYLGLVAIAAANLADTLRYYFSPIGGPPRSADVVRDALTQLERALLPVRRKSIDDPYRHSSTWSGWPRKMVDAAWRLWEIHDSYIRSFGYESMCEPDEKFGKNKYSKPREIHLPEKISPDELNAIDECAAILNGALAKLPPVYPSTMDEESEENGAGEDLGRHYRRLSEKEEKFRAKVLLSFEYNKRQPKEERLTRREICDVRNISLKRISKADKKTNLKTIETWVRSPAGKQFVDQFRKSTTGLRYIDYLEENGLTKPTKT